MVDACSATGISEPEYDLSLVCSTIGRADDLARLVASLPAAAESATVQLIVIDQSSDHVAKDVLANLGSDIRWDYVTSERGLSLGRNVGLPLARGRIIAFPDDDCTYPAKVLDRVVEFFDEWPEVDGLVGRAVTQTTGDNVLRYPSVACKMTRWNIRTGISYGIFLRHEAVEAIGRFDESLGVGCGTAWGAGEETDYLLRALEIGQRLWFLPSLTVLHPPPHPSAEQSFSYGRGIGHVLRNHRYAPPYVAYLGGKKAAKVALLAGRGKRAEARAARAWATGLITGFLDRPGGAVG